MNINNLHHSHLSFHLPSSACSPTNLARQSTMKVILACFAALVYSSRAWVFPGAAIKKFASIASVSASMATAPLIANAVDFSGSYADPNHPNCQRVIAVKGTNAILTGTDGNPGCPPDGSGNQWKLTGKVEDGSIFVDFSPKGGPTDLKGIWDDSTPKGIKWPDGNKWTIKE